MSQQPDTDVPRGGLIPFEAIWLAAGSSLGYAIAFAYEAGIATHFGFPFQLISLELTTVFIGIGALLAALVFVIWVWGEADLGSLKPTGPISIEIIVFIKTLVFLILPIAIVFGRRRWEDTLEITIVILLYSAASWVIPLLRFRKIPGYRSKLDAYQQAKYLRKTSGYLRLFDAMGRQLSTVIFFGIFAVWLAFRLGGANAADEEYFMVVPSTPETVVLRIYAGSAVTCVLDRNKKELVPVYKIRAIADPTLTFQRQKLGRLTMGSMSKITIQTKASPLQRPASRTPKQAKEVPKP